MLPAQVPLPFQLARVAELDVSAASGLVALEDVLYVVADDELFLASFDRAGRPLQRFSLFEGLLPEEHQARKRSKPDLEALTVLPDGRLLALGSGSTASRMRSVTIDPQAPKALRHSDWSPLFAKLAAELAELNIEGAVVCNGRLWLAQRGNGASGHNALIELDLEPVCAALGAGAPVEAHVLCAVRPVCLGALEGAPLGLTDLCAAPDGLLFTATAEPSASTYDDAPSTGSVVGVLSTRGEIVQQARVAPTCKLEGIALEPDGQLWLVADPDDRAQRAPLFRAHYRF